VHNVKRTIFTALGAKKRRLDAADTARCASVLLKFGPGKYSEDIVKASEEKSQHTLVADGVIEKFKALSQHSYTVTTLFCLFQATRIVSSFEFLNMQGASELGSTKATEAANLISAYFKALSAAPKAASTPNNPFVLGYGLTQKLEDIPAGDKDRAENVPYFIPRRFDLTVTTGDGEYSSGVINYCLLTHRPMNDPNRASGEGLRSIDYEKDVGAGFWDAGNTAYKRIRADGKASGADGVMAFSREIFRDYWLTQNFLSYFKVDMNALGKDLVPQDDHVASAQPTASYNEQIAAGYEGQVNKLCLKQDYEFQPMKCQDMDTDNMKQSEELSAFLSLVLTASKAIGLELKYFQRRQARGIAEAILTYTSDVQKNPNLGKSSDTNRKIYFDINMRSLLSITQEASGICNINRLFEDKKRVALWTLTGGVGLAADMIANRQWFINVFTEWRAARRANIQIVTKAGFDLSPASDTWSLTLDQDKSRTTVPIGAEELPRQVNPPVSFTTLENIMEVQKMVDLSKRMQGDGVIIDLENHDMFKEFGTSKGMDGFAKPANQWASSFESRLETTMAALASSLMTKLILPAGNVFEFKSLNTDTEG
ncbi:hypothetical protein COCVIDRAFT_71735, partial [Bipolaris victoriae FI3]